MCMLECHGSSCPHLFHLLLLPSITAIDRGLLPHLRVIDLLSMNGGWRAKMVDLLTRQPPPQLEVVRLIESYDDEFGQFKSLGLKPEAFAGLVERLPLREINMRCFPMHAECAGKSPAMALAFARTIQQNNALRVLELSEGGFATLAKGIKERYESAVRNDREKCLCSNTHKSSAIHTHTLTHLHIYTHTFFAVWA